jgi:hypothetical protein
VLPGNGLSPLLADDSLVGHVALVSQNHPLHILKKLEYDAEAVKQLPEMYGTWVPVPFSKE